MALIKQNITITSITGSFGGVTFKRDSGGSHIIVKPRRVHQRSTAQNRQRKAFLIAKNYGGDLRTVSYNIFRAATGLSPKEPPIDYKP